MVRERFRRLWSCAYAVACTATSGCVTVGPRYSLFDFGDQPSSKRALMGFMAVVAVGAAIGGAAVAMAWTKVHRRKALANRELVAAGTPAASNVSAGPAPSGAPASTPHQLSETP